MRGRWGVGLSRAVWSPLRMRVKAVVQRLGRIARNIKMALLHTILCIALIHKRMSSAVSPRGSFSGCDGEQMPVVGGCLKATTVGRQDSWAFAHSVCCALCTSVA